MPVPSPVRPTRRRRVVAGTSLGAPSLAGAVLLAGAVSACGGDRATAAPTAPSASTTGALSVALTDAPFPFDSVAAVELYVVRVDGQMTEADSAGAAAGKDADATNGDPSKGWVTLAAPNARVDLLGLQGGKTLNLGLKTLPTGTYRGFRLVLNTDSSRVTLKGGAVLTGTSSPGIKFPSAGRSGIKIDLAEPITVVAGGTQMVVDFDLGRSFRLRGASLGRNGLLFTPVVRATAQDRAGALAGVVHADSTRGAALGGATVEVLKAGTAATDTAAANMVATATTDATGAYVAAFLSPGSYAVRASKAVGSATKAGFVASAAVSAGTRTSGVDVVAK